ncbi:hypothetical protein F5884DRAFT_897414 [Xylogone sp. PMI_703]|nr:hypothetical protein F5884DRAFT_897414 [Xylogone sp. PMI_703]
MGSWDCYCAICGGPFCGVRIARKPKHVRRLSQQQNDQFREKDEGGETDEDADTDENENCYDPGVINGEDIKWTDTLHVLGFNPHVCGTTKSFISGPGFYEDFGFVKVVPGDDPNYDDGCSFSCYYAQREEDPVFPFHWCCYELLTIALTGDSNCSSVNKDVLYDIFQELSEPYTSRLNLDFDDPAPPREQFWLSREGEELFVANPSLTPELLDFTKTIFTTTDIEFPSLRENLTTPVAYNPFEKLPYDIIYRICSFSPPKTIISFIMTSKSLLSDYHQNNNFWQQWIKCKMPWFFELLSLLDNSDVMKGKDMMGIFSWANKTTFPRTYTAGPFMSIANRRRIWSLCDQLKDMYLARLCRGDKPGLEPVDRAIIRTASCQHMALVSYPIPAIKELKKIFWIKSWEEISFQEYVLETFWDNQGVLVGISLAPEGQRRLFGRDDISNGTTDDISKEVLKIEKGDWIQGFILHIPGIDICGASQSLISAHTSPTGISVILCSGKETYIGRLPMSGSRRVLASFSESVIVGIKGEIGLVSGETRISSLGLLQAPRPGSNDYMVPQQQPFCASLLLPGDYLWKRDYSNLIQSQIWTSRAIMLFTSKYTGTAVVPRDFVPHEAFIWGGNINELQSLVRLSAHITQAGTVSEIGEDGNRLSRAYFDFRGFRAEYNRESHMDLRTVGIGSELDEINQLEEYCVHFDIDGPGGERVTQVEVSQNDDCMALRLRTNWDREAIWGKYRAENSAKTRDLGSPVIGIIVTFGKRERYPQDTKTNVRTVLTSVTTIVEF